MRINKIVPTTQPSLEQAKKAKLAEIDSWTKTAIIDGFFSTAMGSKNKYDSETTDQDNIKLLCLSSKSADFEVHPVYKGKVPFRVIPEGQTEKIILMHNAVQIQKVVDDLALHIGACKQKGWQLQEAVSIAQTIDAITAIVWL